MSFELNDIKVKYVLGIYKDVEGYPTSEDILYLMVKRAADKGRNLNDVTFTSTQLYKKLGEVDETILQASLDQMIADKVIDVKRETKDAISYRILINPYL